MKHVQREPGTVELPMEQTSKSHYIRQFYSIDSETVMSRKLLGSMKLSNY